MEEDARCREIVESAVRSMEMEGFSPTEEDRRLAYLCITGRISYEEILERVRG